MIGIFDSGSGGLTVLRAIRERMPSVDIVYFGDTKHAPYGNRSRDELTALTARGFHLLQQKGATEFVSACNSVSASVTEILLRPLRIAPASVIEMSRPTVTHLSHNPSANILLVGTKATIDSAMYQQGFQNASITINSLAIPALAGMIEGNVDEESIAETIHTALTDTSLLPFDTLVLGCTHFPLVQPLFEAVIAERGIAATVVDPGVFVAEEVSRQFVGTGEGILRFLTSSSSEAFARRVEMLFPDSAYTIEEVSST